MKKSKTLFEKEMARASFRKRYDEHRRILELELAFLAVLESKRMTYETFARMLGTQKSNISRDLKGKGLQSATLRRIDQMARALGYDFVPLLLPKDKEERARTLEVLLRAA